MRNTTRIITALVAGSALALSGAGAAFAGHDGNPSAKVASYSYSLDAIQPTDVPGSQAEGSTRVKALPNGKLQVTVEAWGLSPNLPHAMHLHGVPGPATDMACPGPAAAGADGVVTVLDGAPFYGGIITSLTSTGDVSPASALALDRFAMSDADGYLYYQRTFTDVPGYTDAGTVQVVVHGIDFDGNGAYAFNADDPFSSRPSSLNAGIPLEATVPVLCGGIAN
ncbi:superoxide dismutase family protein [Agromyces marinus]|uniref:CHRD domain-containing protein n=1 Tax=Agromyces marinus TaxID=1389020 RepID=A0ABM8H033_9MICO|nr:superoxide dismutase family protein [Agromyces marinus]UIP57718.1 hypothetical protein DSM26151_05830 [Agromyces marinus]BDZ54115.1 hypothetical protein GCM10025870_11880 [Agromyces marinus]